MKTSTISTVLLTLLAGSAASGANQYVQHNLVSDVAGVADQTDLNLVNPWGIALSPTSPFWISDNHSGMATVYDSNGNPAPGSSPLVVTIPVPSSVKPPSAPTGQVFNNTTGFAISGPPASFLFATEDGTISGWSGSSPASAVVLVDNSGSGAVYKGLALANTSSGPMLYVANFNSGAVEVYDGNLNPVSTAGGFVDPALPSGFAPFNIQRIGQKLYVTYAKQDAAKHDDVAGPGNGFINAFDFNGNMLGRVVSNGSLNSPWGMALSPSNFGDFSNVLLVGNFGDGTINAFDPCSGAYLGTLQDSGGKNIAIQGLWALIFGNGHGGGDATILYFTAGIPGGGNVEDHGLFGSIQPAALAPNSSQPNPTPQPTPAPQPPQPINFGLAITNFAFIPPTITITAGSQITWTNNDGAAHTVVADDSSFASNAISLNNTFTQTFTKPGTYTYHCSIHPFMKGTVVVH